MLRDYGIANTSMISKLAVCSVETIQFFNSSNVLFVYRMPSWPRMSLCAELWAICLAILPLVHVLSFRLFPRHKEGESLQITDKANGTGITRSLKRLLLASSTIPLTPPPPSLLSSAEPSRSIRGLWPGTTCAPARCATLAGNRTPRESQGSIPRNQPAASPAASTGARCPARLPHPAPLLLLLSSSLCSLPHALSLSFSG